MAALSPAHFLLWARLTTASLALSVTAKEAGRVEGGGDLTNRVSRPSLPLLRVPPASLICQYPLITDRGLTRVTVRLCVSSQALCVWGSGSVGLSSVSITSSVFCHSAAAAAAQSICPSISPAPPPWCLDGRMRMGGLVAGGGLS